MWDVVWDHLYRGWRGRDDGGDPDLRAYLRGEWGAGEALLREWLRDGEESEVRVRRAGWGERFRGLFARRGGGADPVGEAADGGCCA